MANLRRRIPQQTESLFTENHEPFFNSIGQIRKSPDHSIAKNFLLKIKPVEPLVVFVDPRDQAQQCLEPLTLR
jgi:hypothetical protein